MALRDEMMKNIYSDKDAKKIQVHSHIGEFPFNSNVRTEVEQTIFEYRGSAKLMAVDINGQFREIARNSSIGNVFPKVTLDLYIDGELFGTTTQFEIDSTNRLIVMNKSIVTGDLMIAELSAEKGSFYPYLNPVRINESLVLKMRYQIWDNGNNSYYGNRKIVISHPSLPNKSGKGIIIIED